MAVLLGICFLSLQSVDVPFIVVGASSFDVTTVLLIDMGAMVFSKVDTATSCGTNVKRWSGIGMAPPCDVGPTFSDAGIVSLLDVGAALEYEFGFAPLLACTASLYDIDEDLLFDFCPFLGGTLFDIDVVFFDVSVELLSKVGKTLLSGTGTPSLCDIEEALLFNVGIALLFGFGVTLLFGVGMAPL